MEGSLVSELGGMEQRTGAFKLFICGGKRMVTRQNDMQLFYLLFL
jgi:hypothetical protein